MLTDREKLMISREFMPPGWTDEAPRVKRWKEEPDDATVAKRAKARAKREEAKRRAHQAEQDRINKPKRDLMERRARDFQFLQAYRANMRAQAARISCTIPVASVPPDDFDAWAQADLKRFKSGNAY